MTKREQAAKLLEELQTMAAGNATATKIVKTYQTKYDSYKPTGNNPVNWFQVKEAFIAKVDRWILAVQGSSEAVKGYIGDANEAKEGSIAISSLQTIIGNINLKYTVAVEILKAAVALSKNEPIDTLNQFHAAWRKSLDAQKGAFHFSLFETYFVSNYVTPSCSKNDYEHNFVIQVLNQYLEATLIPAKNIESIYLDAWVNSAKDKDQTLWGWGESSDKDAGYICINLTYTTPLVHLINSGSVDVFSDGIWRPASGRPLAYIDDMPRPTGTKEAIEITYGNIALIDLPYKVVVKVQVAPHPGTKPLIAGVFFEFTKARNGQWSHTGNPKLFNAWAATQARKYKVSDLSPE